MHNYPLVIIGAGPAGLSAAIEAAAAGAQVLVIDENAKPGGQLFKQIHKFFGSREHKAGIRGIHIGNTLLEEAARLNINVWLNAEVCSIDPQKTLWVVKNKEKTAYVKAEKIILATGATENAVHFPGWTLPGVMGAGAAQTMMNLHRVLPGKNVLMVGSGNVGVIVSYQLMQAGANVAGIVEAAPQLGGYGVHTAKVCRAGVPFYTSHTVAKAIGIDHVEAAELVRLDAQWNPIPGTQKTVEIDTICLATGLTPLVELAWVAGCQFTYIPQLGGHLPLHNDYMETTVSGMYVAGDIAGIEEASTAMEEGRLAGISAAAALGYYDTTTCEALVKQAWERLDALRCGKFGEARKISKDRLVTVGKERKHAT